jgi:hypothetical protein
MQIKSTRVFYLSAHLTLKAAWYSVLLPGNLDLNQTVTTSRPMTTGSTRLAPANDIDWAALSRGVELSILEALQTDEMFTTSTNLRLQCYHACRILRLEHQPCIPYSLIGRILGTDKKTVKRHFQKHSKRPNGASNGRPPILTPLQMDELFESVADAYRNSKPWTIAQLRLYIERVFQISLEKSTLHHMVERDPRLKTCRGIPMEDSRVAGTSEQITEFFREGFEILQGVPAHFVFNMDEMGHQQWADRKEITCVVPSQHEGDHVNFPVQRTGKRITLIACIALDGSFLKPTIIIPRKTVDTDLLLTGLTSEKVTIKSQPNGFINTPIFDSWVQETFLPELRRRREVFDYEGPALLLMDNCTAHQSPEFREICAAERMIPFYFPPHSSNQLQPLDLLIFGVTKRLLTRFNRLDSVNIQTSHIAQTVCSFMSAATPLNILKTFSLSGICVIIDDDILRCQLRIEKARRLTVQCGAPVPGCDEPDAGSDDEEIWAFHEELAKLLFETEE